MSELPVIDAIFRDEYDVPLGVVALDTMSSTIAMTNQNDAAEVTAVCKRLKQIGEQVKVFALGVHHLGKDETRDAAGSFAWRANVDMMFSAIATGDRVRGIVDRREFCISKARDDADGPISDYRLEDVELGFDDDGDPIKSKAMEPLQTEPAKKRQKPPNKGQLALYAALDECAAAEPVEHRESENGPEFEACKCEAVRVLFLERYQGKKDAARSAFNRTFAAELKTGRIGTAIVDGTELIWRVK